MEMWGRLASRGVAHYRKCRYVPVRYMMKETRKAFIQPKPLDPFAVHSSPGQHVIYKMITLLVALPIVVAGLVGLFVFHEEHKRTPFVPYTYLRLRSKKFPWGDGNHSLFHNPKTNALPDGYETPDEEE